MQRLFERARAAVGLLRTGHRDRVLHAVRLRLSATHVAVGLRRDLTQSYPPPPAAFPLEVRRLEPNDDLWFLDIGDPGISSDTAYIRLGQRHLVEKGFPCWIAMAPDGKPCFMQFVLTARQNDLIREEWGGLFPELGQDEVLFEAAYTAERWRCRGVMPHVMARIAEATRELGARSALTFAQENNVAAVRSCMDAGFRPSTRRLERWRLFRRTVSFVPLSAEELRRIPPLRPVVVARFPVDVPDQPALTPLRPW